MPVSKHTQCDTPPEVLVLPRPLFYQGTKAEVECLSRSTRRAFEEEMRGLESEISEEDHDSIDGSHITDFLGTVPCRLCRHVCGYI